MGKKKKGHQGKTKSVGDRIIEPQGETKLSETQRPGRQGEKDEVRRMKVAGGCLKLAATPLQSQFYRGFGRYIRRHCSGRLPLRSPEHSVDDTNATHPLRPLQGRHFRNLHFDFRLQDEPLIRR